MLAIVGHLAPEGADLHDCETLRKLADHMGIAHPQINGDDDLQADREFSVAKHDETAAQSMSDNEVNIEEDAGVVSGAGELFVDSFGRSRRVTFTSIVRC